MFHTRQYSIPERRPNLFEEGMGLVIWVSRWLTAPAGPSLRFPPHHSCWAYTMLGLYNAGLVDLKGLAVVLPVAFFFGGLMQILVAILEIFSGNPFGAAVFGSYGPFWVILGAINVWFAHDIPLSAMGSAMAVFLAMWAVISAYFTIASLPTNRVLTVILALITIALILLSLGAGLPSVLLTRVGGWVTLAFATLGWYYAFAHLLQFTYGRNVLPLGVVKRKPDGAN